MKTICFLAFLSFMMSCYSQKQIHQDIPILTGESKNSKKVVIRDDNISDSLKVFFQVVVDFKYPLKDTAKCIIINTIRILRMSVKSLSNKEQIISFSYNNETGTPYQKYIWNLCNNKFNYWYRYQPYKMMKDRLKWGKQVVFGGTLYIEPSNVLDQM